LRQLKQHICRKVSAFVFFFVLMGGGCTILLAHAVASDTNHQTPREGQPRHSLQSIHEARKPNRTRETGLGGRCSDKNWMHLLNDSTETSAHSRTNQMQNPASNALRNDLNANDLQRHHPVL